MTRHFPACHGDDPEIYPNNFSARIIIPLLSENCSAPILTKGAGA